MINLASAKFHAICCTETVFLERVLLLYGHTSYNFIYLLSKIHEIIPSCLAYLVKTKLVYEHSFVYIICIPLGEMFPVFLTKGGLISI